MKSCKRFLLIVTNKIFHIFTPKVITNTLLNDKAKTQKLISVKCGKLRAFHSADFHSNRLVSWELVTEGYQEKCMIKKNLPGIVIFWLVNVDTRWPTNICVGNTCIMNKYYVKKYMRHYRESKLVGRKCRPLFSCKTFYCSQLIHFFVMSKFDLKIIHFLLTGKV